MPIYIKHHDSCQCPVCSGWAGKVARSIQYLGLNSTDHTVTFAISGKRWEYSLQPQQCHTVDYLAHRISSAKALAFAKSHALKAERVLP